MNAEAARQLTFYNWPRTDCLYATPKNLAKAGFFYRPNKENLDRVACFTCTVCLVNWEVADDPVQEHVKHGRDCRFMMKTDVQNVPYETTLSHLPLYSWSSICEHAGASFSVDELILGHVTSETSWFSVAVPPLPGHSKPSIFLFDTTKVASRPIEILLDLYATCMVDTMGLQRTNTTAAESSDVSEQKRSFEWLSSVDEIAASENDLNIYRQPLCEISALCTTTAFDECTVTLHGERIVGVLCTAVAVDEARLKKGRRFLV
jgi:hypothetical protein